MERNLVYLVHLESLGERAVHEDVGTAWRARSLTVVRSIEDGWESVEAECSTLSKTSRTRS